MKCCVYTRCYYEKQYLYNFIEHYIKLGFDKIIILNTSNQFNNIIEDASNSNWINSANKFVTLTKWLYQFVEIYDIENTNPHKLFSKYQHLINNYDWILTIDMDELLLLNKKYKTIKNYIQAKLLINNNINSFQFRWGMIEKYDVNYSNNDLKSIINNYKLFFNPHIKTMVKRENLLTITDHYADLNMQPIIYFEENILNNISALHYTKTNKTYNETILFHIHTRNIHNMIIKALVTKYDDGKSINNINNLKILINNFNTYNDNIIEEFKKYVGVKAKLPFNHSSLEIIDKKVLFNFSIKNSIFPLINIEEESNIINNMLKENNIDNNKYYLFVNKIQDIVVKENRFNY